MIKKASELTNTDLVDWNKHRYSIKLELKLKHRFENASRDKKKWLPSAIFFSYFSYSPSLKKNAWTNLNFFLYLDFSSANWSINIFWHPAFAYF